MGKKATKEIFIEKARKIHGYTYNYDKVEYVRGSEKVILTCTHHGDFLQTPEGHLRGKGCRQCAIERPSPKRLTTAQFIEKSKIIHGDDYDYSKSEYIKNSIDVIIICKKHKKEFLQTPNSHLEGRGCSQCSKVKYFGTVEENTEKFIQKAKLVHGDTYRYDDAIFTGVKQKVVIWCKHHGKFEQASDSHLKGSGCAECSFINRGYSRTDYIKKANGRICTFYTLRCFNNEEEFYKIGITMRTIQERYPHVTTMPYNYEIISEIYGEAGFIWDMEKSNMKKLYSFKYQPEITFGGSKNECFTQYTIDEAN